MVKFLAFNHFVMSKVYQNGIYLAYGNSPGCLYLVCLVELIFEEFSRWPNPIHDEQEFVASNSGSETNAVF